MTEPQPSSSGDEPTAVYEIRLQGASPEPLRREFPAATVFTTRSETVLFRRVDEPADLDALIEQLLSMGLVLTEVHEVSLPSGPVRKPTKSAEEGLRDDDDV